MTSTQQLLFTELEVTKERIVEYATQMVEMYPTFKTKTYDSWNSEWKEVVASNTVLNELRNLMGRIWMRRLVQYSVNDLREELHSYLMGGVDAPACDMTFDELVANIWSEFVEPVLEDEPDTTWDEFLLDHEILPKIG